MFINFSNHPSDKWTEKQTEYTNSEFGEIIDIPFPAVPVSARANDVSAMAAEYIEKIIKIKGNENVTVMCQGEFTLAFAVTHRLIKMGIPVVAALTDRNSKEVEKDGVIQKVSYFEFCGYRPYSEDL